METYLIVLLFALVAVMRVMQRVCNKISSNSVSNNLIFFAYGSLYQIIAGVFAIITVIITGFYGFNSGLVICSVLSAILFAIELFSGIEALKGCSIAVSSIFSFGSLVISVIVSYFWFDENMSVYQVIGLIVFIISAYLLTASDKKQKYKLSTKTIIMLLINFFSNGLIMVVQKYFALKVDGGNTALFSFFTFMFSGVFLLICFGVSYSKQRKSLQSRENKAKILSKTLIICGLLLAVALFTINIVNTEMSKTLPSIIIFPVSSAESIIIAILVGYFVFKEKLTKKNIVGIVLAVLSIIIVSVLTPENLHLFQ